MKRLLIIIVLLWGAPCFAQGYRFDSQISQEFLTTAINGATNFLTIPSNAQVAFCSFPANAVPCTNKATTYTSNTLGTPCSTSTQIVLVNTTSCVASPDAQQNWGVWVAAGSYAYTITIGGANLGPYNVTIGCAAGTTCVSAGANNAFTGNNTFKSINNVLWVDGVSLTTMQACLNALPSSGGTCMVPPNYTETLAANLVFSKTGSTLQFNGPATITMGAFQVTAASGVHGVSILSPYSHSQLTHSSGANIGASFSGYTGTGAVFQIGDSSGFASDWYVKGIGIPLGSAGAGAIAFHGINFVSSHVDDVSVVGGAVSGQIGLQFDGTNSYSGLDVITNLDCGYSVSSTNGTCMKFGNVANAFTIIGGHGNIGGSSNGSVCLDNNSGSVANIDMFDCDVAQTALTVESTQNNATWGFLRIDAGVTNFANFGSGSRGNWLFTNDATRPVTDSGVAGTNSVLTGDRFAFASRFWQWQCASAGLCQLVDLSDSGAPALLVAGAGSPTTINAPGANAVQLNMAGTGGTCFGNGSSACRATVASSGLGTFPLYATSTRCNPGSSASPTACGSAASGTVVVPTTTTTYTVNTTAVDANSDITITPITDASGLTGSPTCNAPPTPFIGYVSARVAGTSFTFTLPSTTGASCWTFWIRN